MKLADLPYSYSFYLDGVRYKQLIRVKNPISDHDVVCTTGHQGLEIVNVPSTAEVKPVMRG